METLYAIAIETISTPEFTCKDENENPWLFRSKLTAQKEIVDSKMIELQSFMDGHREFDDINFDIDEIVVEVEIIDGILLDKDREVDPHTIKGPIDKLTITD